MPGSAFCLHAYATTPTAAHNVLRVLGESTQSADEEIRRACVQGNLICYLTAWFPGADSPFNVGKNAGSLFIQAPDGFSDTRPAMKLGDLF